ncbi:hypothetical protein Goshw_022460 [Gossypium schwendimanii]|uniref:Uncharacterized protein n=1 Tax=Gossypium schwendimanii TaxID=34291 RepID=A0A7J9NCA2_GOSSC|nr:hypothetical protein [Gossypium schwendimanii]
MSKEEFEQRWARKSLREMLLAVKERVGKLEKSIEDAKGSDNALRESIEDLREQSRDFVTLIENYFHAKGIVDDAVKANTFSMFLTDIALL